MKLTIPMNIQYVRLNDDICETLNLLAHDRHQTVSDFVNEILREFLEGSREKAAGAAE